MLHTRPLNASQHFISAATHQRTNNFIRVVVGQPLQELRQAAQRRRQQPPPSSKLVCFRIMMSEVIKITRDNSNEEKGNKKLTRKSTMCGNRSKNRGAQATTPEQCVVYRRLQWRGWYLHICRWAFKNFRCNIYLQSACNEIATMLQTDHDQDIKLLQLKLCRLREGWTIYAFTLIIHLRSCLLPFRRLFIQKTQLIQV